MSVPDTAEFRATDIQNYEVVRGTCGACGTAIAFHRVADLGRTGVALGAEAPCPSCGATLRIKADTAHYSWELLLVEAVQLFQQKRYMQTIALSAQALEMFLAYVLYFVFIQRPRPADVEDVRRTKELLEKHTSSMTLEPLRNVVAKLLVHGITPNDLAESRRWNPELVNLGRTRPSDDALEYAPAEIRNALRRLRDSRIAELRNSVVHATAYRPTPDEAWSLEQEVGDIAGKLTSAFGMPELMTVAFWVERDA
jgi:hypothetical protein